MKKKVKVILLKDIDNLGKKFDVKEVRLGYARNFLLPKNLVKLATKKNLEWLEKQLERVREKSEKELAEFQKIAEKLEGLEVNFEVKVGEKGELFESINSSKISKRLKEMGFDIKKSQILLESSIKEVGEFPVKISLPHNLEAEIKVIVSQIKE